MNRYTIKPTIEPNDKYEKAKQDCIKAAESLKELSPNQCKRLAQELFGYEAFAQMCRIMQQYN